MSDCPFLPTPNQCPWGAHAPSFPSTKQIFVQPRKSSESQLPSSQPDPTQRLLGAPKVSKTGCVGLSWPSMRPPWKRPSCLWIINPRAEGHDCHWAVPRSHLGSLGAQASRDALVQLLPYHPSLHVFLQRKNQALVFQNRTMLVFYSACYLISISHTTIIGFVLVYNRGKLEMTAELIK